MGSLVGFISEARRRRVFRAGGLYVVGAWVLLQIVALALQALEFPDALLRYFWSAAFIGFPIALLFSWYYDITAAGIRRTPPVHSADTEALALEASSQIAEHPLWRFIHGIVLAKAGDETGAQLLRKTKKRNYELRGYQ